MYYNIPMGFKGGLNSRRECYFQIDYVSMNEQPAIILPCRPKHSLCKDTIFMINIFWHECLLPYLPSARDSIVFYLCHKCRENIHLNTNCGKSQSGVPKQKNCSINSSSVKILACDIRWVFKSVNE